MTARKSSLVRSYKPERASRETMAYLLDVSPDTFDRLVSDGSLPAARECSGIKRWDVVAVMRRWDGVSTSEEIPPEPFDPFLKNLGVFRGKTEGRSGTA